MRIEEEIKLDYSDVLFRPKRSTLKSRSEVDLKRKYKFLFLSSKFFRRKKTFLLKYRVQNLPFYFL